MSRGEPIRVTVLIDTYESGQFIEQAIESVLAQDFPPEQMEVLVVDDGSTDDTAERVRKYGHRVQYLYKANGGQASAMNYGLERALGEIVAFLDGDDYWLPGKLTRIMDEFRKSPETGMVYHGFYWCDSAGGQLRKARVSGSSGFIPASPKDFLSYDLCHPTSTLAFRSSVLQRLLPVPESLVIQADAHLFACVIFLAPVAYIDQPLVAYRVHASNASLGWFAGSSMSGDGPHFQGDSDAEARLRRSVATSRAIGEGVREWLEKNGFDPNGPDLRPFVMQWSFSARAFEFKLSPPGRLRLSRYFFDYLRYSRARMGWRFQAVTCINIFASLIVGYNRFRFLEEWPLRLRRFLGRPVPQKLDEAR